MTREELEKLKNVDIRSADSSSLVDISTVKVDMSLPVVERVKAYLQQIGNPYCFIDHGIKVKVCFSGEKSMEECLKSAIAIDAK